MSFLRKALAYLMAAILAVPLSASAFRLPTPWGDVEGDVGDVARTIVGLLNPNPLGVPTATSITGLVVTHPDTIIRVLERPADVAYLAVVDAIVEGRNAVILNGGHRIPPHIRSALKGFYSDQLMDSVRWSTDWNAVQNTLQAAQMFANKDTNAIALLNAIVFRDRTKVDSLAVWAHELHHVKQYQEWGVVEFAKRWMADASVTGPVEAPAYEQGNMLVAALESAGKSLHAPLATDSRCEPRNKSIAVCDLWVANQDRQTFFDVAAVALASGHGSNQGRMQLLVVHNRGACNAAADHVASVDTATRLSGEGYTCRVGVDPGQTVRVVAIAPNDRADAVQTLVTASRVPGPLRLRLSRNYLRGGMHVNDSVDVTVSGVAETWRFTPETAAECEMALDLDAERRYQARVRSPHLQQGQWIRSGYMHSGQANASAPSCFLRAELL